MEQSIPEILKKVRRSQRNLIEFIAQLTQKLLNGEVSRKSAAEIFLKIYTDPLPKSEQLEELLSMLILVDESEGSGAPTKQELQKILETLERLKNIY